MATGTLAVVGYYQLRALNQQLIDNEKKEKLRNTHNACQRIENDPTLMTSQENIFKKSMNGKDYTKLDDKDKFDIVILLNYMDGLAAGVLNDIYDNDMVYKALHLDIGKAVCVFIKGESASGWKADKSFFSQEQYSSLMKLYNQWFEKNDSD